MGTDFKWKTMRPTKEQVSVVREHLHSTGLVITFSWLQRSSHSVTTWICRSTQWQYWVHTKKQNARNNLTLAGLRESNDLSPRSDFLHNNNKDLRHPTATPPSLTSSLFFTQELTTHLTRKPKVCIRVLSRINTLEAAGPHKPTWMSPPIPDSWKASSQTSLTQLFAKLWFQITSNLSSLFQCQTSPLCHV